MLQYVEYTALTIYLCGVGGGIFMFDAAKPYLGPWRFPALVFWPIYLVGILILSATDN